MPADNPQPLIGLEHVSWIGKDLRRPECVLCTADGRLHLSDWRGGVTRVDAHGNHSTVLGTAPAGPLRPNGICLLPDGSYLLAHLGDDDGGVYRLFPDGSVEPFVLAVDGDPLPPTNFVHRDIAGRTWITVSTRRRPRALGYRPGAGDGFVVLGDADSVRIVADGLGYTNECLAHPDGTRLFVNETFERRHSAGQPGTRLPRQPAHRTSDLSLPGRRANHPSVTRGRPVAPGAHNADSDWH